MCEGSRIESIKAAFSLHQLIKEVTHILNETSSCIDLSFTAPANQDFILFLHSEYHPQRV